MSSGIPNMREAMFESLIRNALDFLNRSISELEENPKYSVINFHAAIELFLKARLMYEHWSLIIKQPEKANLSKFMIGDFHSISMEDAILRLKNILDEDLTLEERRCFNQIREHRNKLVHFFHPKYANNPDVSTIQSVVSEQCRGWYYLHTIIITKWVKIFQPYLEEIEHINQKLLRNRIFLETKYQAILPEIKALKSQGEHFSLCSSCGFEALKSRPFLGPLFETHCLVCFIKSYYIGIQCQNCGEGVLFYGSEVGRCYQCHHLMSIAEIMDITSAWSPPAKDGEGIQLAYCSDCGRTESPTVMQVEDKWLCLSCLTIHKPFEISRCGWCGEYVTGKVGDYWSPGCIMCIIHIEREAYGSER